MISPSDFIAQNTYNLPIYKFHQISDWIFQYFSILAAQNRLSYIKQLVVRNYIEESSIPQICCYTGIVNSKTTYENARSYTNNFVTELIISNDIQATSQQATNSIADICSMMPHFIRPLLDVSIETENMAFRMLNFSFNTNINYYPNPLVGGQCMLFTINGCFSTNKK